MINYEIKSYGPNAILIELEQKISEEISLKVNTLYDALQTSELRRNIKFIIPAYASITIGVDISIDKLSDFINEVKLLIEHISISQNQKNIRTWTLPVCYDEEFALDAYRCVSNLELTFQEIIELHSQGKYMVYMMGFLPGFPYLGILPERLNLTRLDKPRKIVPKGSVGIAGLQTGIYPVQSPGGWNIIGNCPIPLFDYYAKSPVLLERGDKVKFSPVDKKRYHELKKEFNNNQLNLLDLLEDDN